MKDVLIRRVNETFIHIDTDDGFLRTLSDYYSFFADNYMWSPKYKSGFWDGKIRLLNARYGLLYAGLLPNLLKFLEENEKTYELDGFEEFMELEAIKADFERFLSTIKLPDGFDVRDYQLDAILASLRDRRGLIISPTGSGKSLIIYLMIRYLMSRQLVKKVLLLVPTINLVGQMFSDFGEYAENDSWDNEKYCHQIIGGRDKESKKPIFISTWQSVYDIKDKKYFEQFDSMFVDEVHTAEAKSISGIVERSANTKYRYGLTGTLKDTSTNPLQLIGMFGEVHTTTTTKDLMDAGILSDTKVLTYILRYTDREVSDFWAMISAEKEKQKRYQKELNYVYQHKKRTFVILKLLEKFKGMNSLLLFRKLDHAKIVFDILTENGYDCYYMNAGTPPEERERIRKYAEVNKGVVILSTYQIFQLGINIRNLHNAIYCAPSKGRIRVLQSFGRLLRKSTDGTTGYLIDIIDDLRHKDRNNYCFQHGLERLKYYNEEGIKVIYKKVNL